jgi:hypothetical protein
MIHDRHYGLESSGGGCLKGEILVNRDGDVGASLRQVRKHGDGGGKFECQLGDGRLPVPDTEL